MNFIKKHLFSNFRWKMLSIVFAVCLWFYCMNITAGAEKTDVVLVNLTIANDELFTSDSMLLQNRSEITATTVTLRVKGLRNAIDELNHDASIRAKFSAYIDLGLVELRNPKNLGSPMATTVFVDKPDGYDIMGRSPETVNVILEQTSSASRVVTIYTEGKTAEGYTDLPKEVDQVTVTVTGPSSLVSKVAEVSAVVNVKGLTSDVTQTVTPVAYDYAGNVVEDVVIAPDTLDITVPIYKLAKIPISKPEYRGEPPEGYVVTGIDWNPKYAEVMGTEQAISEMREITLLPIEGVEQMTSDTTVPYDLRAYLPTNIQIVNGTHQEIIVDVFIEELVEKKLTIAKDAINFSGATPAAVEPEAIEITVSGAQSDMEAFDAESVTASADLSGLEPGEHEVSVTIVLPAYAAIVGVSPVVSVTIPEEPTDVSNVAGQPRTFTGR